MVFSRTAVAIYQREALCVSLCPKTPIQLCRRLSQAECVSLTRTCHSYPRVTEGQPCSPGSNFLACQSQTGITSIPPPFVSLCIFSGGPHRLCCVEVCGGSQGLGRWAGSSGSRGGAGAPAAGASRLGYQPGTGRTVGGVGSLPAADSGELEMVARESSWPLSWSKGPLSREPLGRERVQKPGQAGEAHPRVRISCRWA